MNRSLSIKSLIALALAVCLVAFAVIHVLNRDDCLVDSPVDDIFFNSEMEVTRITVTRERGGEQLGPVELTGDVADEVLGAVLFPRPNGQYEASRDMGRYTIRLFWKDGTCLTLFIFWDVEFSNVYIGNQRWWGKGDSSHYRGQQTAKRLDELLFTN